MKFFKNATILITGGSGSWGNELTKQLLAFDPKEIRIFSRGEINQVAMERKFINPKLKFIIGDVRDLENKYNRYQQYNSGCHSKQCCKSHRCKF